MAIYLIQAVLLFTDDKSQGWISLVSWHLHSNRSLYGFRSRYHGDRRWRRFVSSRIGILSAVVGAKDWFRSPWEIIVKDHEERLARRRGRIILCRGNVRRSWRGCGGGRKGGRRSSRRRERCRRRRKDRPW